MTSNYSAFGFTNLIRILFLTLFVIVLVYCFVSVSAETQSTNTTNCSNILYTAELLINYNNTYPLTAPIKSKNFVRYRIGIISDEDKKTGSYSKNYWSAFFLKGWLTYFPSTKRIEIKFDENKHKVTNRIANANRGLELSELVVFNGKLLTCDDKTGIIYEVMENNSTTIELTNQPNITLNETFKLVPQFILSDGNGKQDEVFKCEWLAVKDHQLYVGSFGKDFKLKKKIKYSSWIKRINVNGLIEHINWSDNYDALMRAANVSENGYMSHETAMYSRLKNKWYFLPRKVSNKTFNYVEDESKGSNIMIEASDDFKTIKSSRVGELNSYLGFSSSKFLPNFNDEIIVALKTKEVNNSFETYITAFDIKGNTLYNETLVSDQLKFEGLEFI